LSSAEVRYLRINFDEILRKLKRYAKSKAGAHKTRAIILSGSLAKGSYTGTSDADILVIADSLPADILERYALYSEPRMPIDIEPRVYTTSEFLRRIRERDRFALESLQIGVVLYGEEFVKDLRRSLNNQAQPEKRMCVG